MTYETALNEMLIGSIDRFLSYTPTGRTDYGYALGWFTSQMFLLAHLENNGVLTHHEAAWLHPPMPDRKHFIRYGADGRRLTKGGTHA